MNIIDQARIPVAGTTCANLFNSKGWLKVITKTYGIEFKAVVNDNHQFILPYCLIHDKFFPSVKSIPFGDYTLNNYSEDDLKEALHLLKSKYPDYYIETSVVSKNSPSVDNFTSTKYGFLIQVDIKKWRESRDWKETYERNIRNALNYGLEVEINKSKEALRQFYKLHAQLRIQKFKKLPQPFEFFENIYTQFIEKGQGFLLETWHKNNLIASWVILIHHDTLYYKLGASDLHNLHLRPNDLLFRSLMQYGSDHGFKTIDLGFSGATKNYEGLIRFKSKEGGDKTPIYRIERYPTHFNFGLLTEKINYLSNITKKAIDSGDLSIIESVSEKYYKEFA